MRAFEIFCLFSSPLAHVLFPVSQSTITRERKLDCWLTPVKRACTYIDVVSRRSRIRVQWIHANIHPSAESRRTTNGQNGEFRDARIRIHTHIAVDIAKAVQIWKGSAATH